MIITKALAGEIAKSLCAKAMEKMQALNKKNSEIVTALYLKALPKAIVNFNARYPGWLNSVGALYGYDPQGRSLSIQFTKLVPAKEMSKFFSKNKTQIIGLNEASKKALADYRALYNETCAALLSIRTVKRLEKEWPEAMAHIPKNKIVSAPVSKVADTRAKLKALK